MIWTSNFCKAFQCSLIHLLRLDQIALILIENAQVVDGVECRIVDGRGKSRFTRDDQRSDDYYWKFLVFNADVLFGREKLQAALDELDGYSPWHPGNISASFRTSQVCL